MKTIINITRCVIVKLIFKKQKENLNKQRKSLLICVLFKKNLFAKKKDGERKYSSVNYLVIWKGKKRNKNVQVSTKIFVCIFNGSNFGDALHFTTRKEVDLPIKD